MQSDLTCEVVRRSRHTETAEIIRAGEGPPVEQRQAPLDQRTVAQLTGPKDAVESLPDHVQRLVRFAEVQPEYRDIAVGIEADPVTGNTAPGCRERRHEPGPKVWLRRRRPPRPPCQRSGSHSADSRPRHPGSG